jgi:hypothetical protein
MTAEYYASQHRKATQTLDGFAGDQTAICPLCRLHAQLLGPTRDQACDVATRQIFANADSPSLALPSVISTGLPNMYSRVSGYISFVMYQTHLHILIRA